MVFIIYDFKSNEFDVRYIESEIEHPVLWESHCHSQYEMIAVAKGDITVMLEGQNYRLKENQILIVPPLLHHSVTANENTRTLIAATYNYGAAASVFAS